MSIFNQRVKQGIDSYKEDLRAKDGNVHMVLIETIVDFGEKQKKEYTSKINNFLDYMQMNRYEILDVKFNMQSERSLAGTSYETMIIYK